MLNMGAFGFDKCCFCIELRVGCLIIGYLNLIRDIVLILLCIIGIAWAAVVSNVADEEEDRTTGTVMAIVVGLLLVLFILFLAFTIILLVGLHKYKRGHVKAFLIFTSIVLVLRLIYFFATFGINNEYIHARHLFEIPLPVTSMLVISRYYGKMDEPSYKQAIYNTA